MLIVCNGMLRSGSTLQYNIARAIIELKNIGEAEGFFFSEELQNKEKLLGKWRLDSRLHIIKTHDILPNLRGNTKFSGLKILYIFRDIRNVAVSLKRKYQIEDDKLIPTLDKAILVYHSLKTYDAVLWQRYENVVQHQKDAIREISKFLRISLTEDELNKIKETCSSENLKKASKRLQLKPINILKRVLLSLARTFQIKKILQFLRVSNTVIISIRKKLIVTDKNTLLHPNHISSSRRAIGVWRHSLSEKEICLINERHLNWLLETGYTVQ